VATTDDVIKDPLGGSINDSFTYRLVAPGVQPAVGYFNFSIVLQVNIMKIEKKIVKFVNKKNS
jgi:hypothetical protein